MVKIGQRWIGSDINKLIVEITKQSCDIKDCYSSNAVGGYNVYGNKNLNFYKSRFDGGSDWMAGDGLKFFYINNQDAPNES